ncbi:MAG: hypothetical protein C0490_17625 [Marivirga sp.]|nr:hypothetical protein [Marivirga sp.]
MKTKMITLLLALVSWGAYAQHDHAGHDDKKMDQSMAIFKDAKLGTAYEHYTHLKEALVASKGDEAKMAAGQLQKALSEVSDGKKASEQAAKIASTSNLEDQRKTFTDLSNEVAALVKGGKLSKGAIYMEYCPMANNNTGAYWLSNEKQIKNPYFGDAMLKCGSVKETIQ